MVRPGGGGHSAYPDEMGACALLSQQSCPANMVDCCMGMPQRARNASLRIPEWGSIEEWTPDSGLMDQGDYVNWGGPGRHLPNGLRDEPAILNNLVKC